MKVTYAGQLLGAPVGELADHIEVAYLPGEVIDHERPAWQAAALQFRDPAEAARYGRIRLGSLYWPLGASRWAFGHFLADQILVDALQSLCVSGGSLVAQPLVLDDGAGYSVTASLYLLPPRPLFRGSGNNAWVLTLVDQRYFWWEQPGTVGVTGGSTTWATLIAAVGSALGVTVTADAIPAAYLKPAAPAAGRTADLPPLLDLAAQGVGMRVVCGLDGTVRLQNPVSARASQEAQAALWGSTAGGLFPALTQEAGALPASLQAVFPRADSGTPSTTPYVVTTTLASLALPELAGAATHATSPAVAMSALATFAGGGSPTNATELEALAAQYATDWYRWQEPRLHARYAGIVPYTPDGFSDSIEWAVRGEVASTRVQRPGRQTVPPGSPLPYYGSGGSGPVTIDQSYYYAGTVNLGGPVNVLGGSTGPVTVLNNTLVNFGVTSNQAAKTPGVLGLPYCSGAGAPSWTPAANTYPFQGTTAGLYWWNGSVWVLIATGTGTTTPATTSQGWEWHRHRGTTPFSRYHIAGIHGSAGSKSGANTFATDTLYAVPMCFPGGGVVDRLAVDLRTDASNMLFGIYRETGSGNKFPGSKVYASAVTDLSAGAPLLVTCSPAFTPSVDTLYWLVATFDSSTVIAAYSDVPDGRVPDVIGVKGGATGFEAESKAFIATARVWDGTLPATFPAISDATDLKDFDYMPMIGVRYSS